MCIYTARERERERSIYIHTQREIEKQEQPLPGGDAWRKKIGTNIDCRLQAASGDAWGKKRFTERKKIKNDTGAVSGRGCYTCCSSSGGAGVTLFFFNSYFFSCIPSWSCCSSSGGAGVTLENKNVYVICMHACMHGLIIFFQSLYAELYSCIYW